MIVVGAGPSGSHAAMRCAELGLDVLLLDSERFPRDKACGGIVGESVIGLIGKEAVSVMECDGMGNDLFFNWKFIGSLERHQYFLKRRKFDHYMVKRAVAAGAEFKECTRAAGLTVTADTAVVHTTSGDFQSNLVVGADGTNSVIGKSVGLSHREDVARYVSLKAEVDVSHEKARELGVEEPNRQRTLFFSDLVGFAWIVPNNGSVNVGYGSTMSKAKNLKERFHAFLGKLGLAPQFERGSQIPYSPTKKVYADRVLLTGDAGGFVDPWTGCGIEEGIAASERAAVVCKRAVDSQDFSSATLSLYQELCRDTIKRLAWRAGWVKTLDQLIPGHSDLPFWVEYMVLKFATLA